MFRSVLNRCEVKYGNYSCSHMPHCRNIFRSSRSVTSISILVYYRLGHEKAFKSVFLRTWSVSLKVSLLLYSRPQHPDTQKFQFARTLRLFRRRRSSRKQRNCLGGLNHERYQRYSEDTDNSGLIRVSTLAEAC